MFSYICMYILLSGFEILAKQDIIETLKTSKLF